MPSLCFGSGKKCCVISDVFMMLSCTLGILLQRSKLYSPLVCVFMRFQPILLKIRPCNKLIFGGVPFLKKNAKNTEYQWLQNKYKNMNNGAVNELAKYSAWNGGVLYFSCLNSDRTVLSSGLQITSVNVMKVQTDSCMIPLILHEHTRQTYFDIYFELHILFLGIVAQIHAYPPGHFLLVLRPFCW